MTTRELLLKTRTLERPAQTPHSAAIGEIALQALHAAGPELSRADQAKQIVELYDRYQPVAYLWSAITNMTLRKARAGQTSILINPWITNHDLTRVFAAGATPRPPLQISSRYSESLTVPARIDINYIQPLDAEIMAYHVRLLPGETLPMVSATSEHRNERLTTEVTDWAEKVSIVLGVMGELTQDPMAV